MFLALTLPGRALAQGAVPTSDVALVPPRVLTESPIRYPERAIKNKHFAETTRVLLLDVDAQGSVTSAAVVGESQDAPDEDGFSAAAREAAQGLRFSPATRNETPIAARIKYQYTFRPPLPVLSGRLARSDTDAPLPGVSVVVTTADGSSKSATTDAKGQFVLRDLAAGEVSILAAPAGLEPIQTKEMLAYAEETALVLRAKAPADAAAPPPVSTQEEVPEEVKVSGEKPAREVAKRSLSRQEMELLPGTNGDALRSVQSLPGVARPFPFSGQLIVRGSDDQDTQTFVDGTHVPAIYHFGGLSSVLPTESLEKLDFYPGNFSAAWGRGMGGVVDVAIRSPRTDAFHGMAQFDMIDARLMVEGPLGKGWAFRASGRRSWFDVWLSPVLEAANAGVTTVPRYYDYQLVLEKTFAADHTLRLAFFGSDDAFRSLSSAGRNDFAIRFWRAQALYRNRLSDSTDVRVVAATGFDGIDQGLGAYRGTLSHRPVTLRTEVSHKVVSSIRANVGIDAVYEPYDLAFSLPLGTDLNRQELGRGRVANSTSSGNRLRAGLYTEWELTPWKGTRIVPSARVDLATNTSQAEFSPRLNMRQEVASGPYATAFKGAVGMFYQPPSIFESDPVFGQTGLRTKRSLHSDVGLEQKLGEHTTLSSDVFYKWMDRLVVTGRGDSGEGRSYGVETLLRYQGSEKFFGWLAYTLSKSERRPGGEVAWNRFQYDQTHILTMVGSYGLGRGWRLGGRFRLVSGNLYTPLAQGGYDSTFGSYFSAEGQPYAARLPAFHQLDARVDKVWAFKTWKLTAYADIQNIYNHQAVEGVAYNHNYTQTSYFKGLTILPSLGMRAEF